MRRKIVETGDVDVMISIRSNFFYTRTVPCELWHFDKGKPAEHRDQVLMIDARNVYRKVTRKIYDFSPEQLANLTAIVWLYRGQRERFLGLVRSYFERVCSESAAVPREIEAFDTTLNDLREQFEGFASNTSELAGMTEDKRKPFDDAVTELCDAAVPFESDRAGLLREMQASRKNMEGKLPEANEAQHAARAAFDPIADQIKGLIKQVDLLYKLAARVAEAAAELSGEEGASEFHDRREATRALKQLDMERKAAVEQLKQVAYSHRQIVWLQDRFPKAEFQPVAGLVRLVGRADIEAADWTLTPGRYVGVAPHQVDEDFDFEETLRDLNLELADLNKEAINLARTIQENFEQLGV